MENKKIYASGEYSRFFSPESASFPFARVYEEKRRLILERLDVRSGGAGRDILDLGGGRGRFSIPLSARNRVCLADISIAMIGEALENLRAATPETRVPDGTGAGRGTAADGGPRKGALSAVCCDAEDPPFGRESFDVVLAIDLLPHVASPGRLFGAILGLLRPGGTAVIDNSNSSPFWMFAYPDYVDWRRRPVAFLRTFLHGGVLPDWTDSIAHWSKDEFVGYLCGAGFAIVDFIELGPSYCPKWHLAFCRKPSS